MQVGHFPDLGNFLFAELRPNFVLFSSRNKGTKGKRRLLDRFVACPYLISLCRATPKANGRGDMLNWAVTTDERSRRLTVVQ
jgi:hypothetical protein